MIWLWQIKSCERCQTRYHMHLDILDSGAVMVYDQRSIVMVRLGGDSLEQSWAMVCCSPTLLINNMVILSLYMIQPSSNMAIAAASVGTAVHYRFPPTGRVACGLLG